MTKQLNLCLGDLANPLCYNNSIELPQNVDKARLVKMLEGMLTIRFAEQTIAELIANKQANCPCHLATGQEAIAIGVAELLTPQDLVFGTHRSHAHYLALGGSVYGLLAEVFGKASGCAAGLGGSQHLIAHKHGFAGSVPLVAGTIPLAVGAGLAAKLKGSSDIGVCFFGDGATEEGVFHESLNLAAVQKIPVLFVCENNLYASHLDIKQRQPADTTARFAHAHCVDYKVVDGNDVVAVKNATEELVTKIRREKTPGFLEAVTYRWLGHVGPNEDIDVGVRRSIEDLNSWKKRDPIKRLVDAMLVKELITENNYEKLAQEVKNNIDKALKKAQKDPYPKKNKLLYKVYQD